MSTRQQKTPSGLTLKQLLIAIIVIGMFTIVVSVAFLIQQNLSTNTYAVVEQTMQVAQDMQAVPEILSKTKNKAAINGKSYTVEFRNSPQGVEYSMTQIDLKPEWKKLSSDTAIKVQESKIVFNSKGTLTSPIEPLSFEYKGHIRKICPPTYLISISSIDQIQKNVAQFYLKDEAKKQSIIIIKKDGKPLAEIKPISANNQQIKSDDLCS